MGYAVASHSALLEDQCQEVHIKEKVSMNWYISISDLSLLHSEPLKTA